jgi:hypothetical protein
VGMVRVEGRARIPSSAKKGRSTTATLRYKTSWYRGVQRYYFWAGLFGSVGIAHANSPTWAVGYYPNCQLPMGEKDTIPLLT